VLKPEIMGGVRKIYMSNFRFVSQIFEGAILLSMSKIALLNGSCAQDAAGIAVADQCRHLPMCFAMCPLLAPATSFA